MSMNWASFPINAGHRYWVEVTDFDNYDLIGKIVKEPTAATK
jgi:hypothetical protein